MPKARMAKPRSKAGKSSRTYGFAKNRYNRLKKEVVNKARIDRRTGEIIHSPLTETELSYRSGYMHAYRDNAADHAYHVARSKSKVHK